MKFWRLLFRPKGLDLKIVDALNKLNPDLVGLVEVDTGSLRARRNDIEFFEEKLGMKSSAGSVKYAFERWKKIFKVIPLLRFQGNAIISKSKLSEVNFHVLKKGLKNVLIEATVHCPKKITMFLVHLPLGGKARREQIEEIITIVNKVKTPVVLMGDFNIFNGIKEIQKLIEQTNLVYDFDGKPTFPSYQPKKRLDYVFASKNIKIKNYKVLDFPFSDHLPLMVDFEVKK